MEQPQNSDAPSPVWPPPPMAAPPAPIPEAVSFWQSVRQPIKRALAFTLYCFVMEIGDKAYQAGSLSDKRVWQDVFAPEKFWLAFFVFFTMGLSWSLMKAAWAFMKKAIKKS